MSAQDSHTAPDGAVSDRELELVKEGYAAFKRGDLDWVLEHFHPEILVENRAEAPDAATFHGHSGFLRYLEGWLSAWEEFRMEPQEFIVTKDQILVLLRQYARGKGSDVEMVEEVAHLWTVRDEQAVAYRVFTHQADALRAIGMKRR
jgi:ketosteroid isomerase-like protein